MSLDYLDTILFSSRIIQRTEVHWGKICALHEVKLVQSLVSHRVHLHCQE